MALHKLLRHTHIDTVEWDAAVVRVAKQFFGYLTDAFCAKRAQ